jgi:hypothetical protein
MSLGKINPAYQNISGTNDYQNRMSPQNIPLPPNKTLHVFKLNFFQIYTSNSTLNKGGSGWEKNAPALLTIL